MVMIPQAPSDATTPTAISLLLNEQQLVITAHQGSDSSLMFHNDMHWTRSTPPIITSRMAPET